MGVGRGKRLALEPQTLSDPVCCVAFPMRRMFGSGDAEGNRTSASPRRRLKRLQQRKRRTPNTWSNIASCWWTALLVASSNPGRRWLKVWCFERCCLSCRRWGLRPLPLRRRAWWLSASRLHIARREGVRGASDGPQQRQHSVQRQPAGPLVASPARQALAAVNGHGSVQLYSMAAACCPPAAIKMKGLRASRGVFECEFPCCPAPPDPSDLDNAPGVPCGSNGCRCQAEAAAFKDSFQSTFDIAPSPFRQAFPPAK